MERTLRRVKTTMSPDPSSHSYIKQL